ncbi:Ig-like domain-containing protein [Pseudomonas frederiksbergensis]|nr:Ig-like domain-containing protein [Pseudomonas frederiksbergensis]
MTLPEFPENVVLALALPSVPGATRPVEGADIGVSLVIYDLVIDGEGATVEIDPPLSGTMNPGDVMALWLVGETTFLSQKIIDNPNAITTLRIPKGRLHSDRINELFYTITRGSQNIGTSTPTVKALYNKIRPGLKDTKPEIDGHSELELLLPDAIKNGVGPDFVSAQVCVSYPYCRAYDRISLKCNGELMTYQVGQFEAPQPPDPGSAIPTTACFTVTRTYLDSAKRPSGTLDFSFTVTDQLGNTPDPDAIWSATQTVDEDLAGTRLLAPILREIQNDPGDDSSIIDLEKLGKNPLLVIVLTADNRFRAGDTINVTYTARLEGKPDVVVAVSGLVEADEFGQTKPCILQVPNDKVVAGSRVTVPYDLFRGGALVGNSRTAVARVVGEGLPDLLPPRFQKSLGGALDSLDPANLQGANGQVELLGFRPGDTVQLIVEGAPGAGSPTFTPLPLNTNSRANFPLNSAFIAANMGKPVRFHYLLRRNGKEYKSQMLNASVSRVPDYAPALPMPKIDDVSGDELDVTALAASSRLLVQAWPHQVPGQRVWLRYQGIDSSGATVEHESLKGEANDSASGLTQPIPIDWLKALKHGSGLTIHISLNFDGILDAAEAVVFSLRSYLIKATPPLTIDTRDMDLSGFSVKVSIWPKTGQDSVGNTDTREAQGGSPPYLYESLDSSIASVDQTGKVTGNKNGVTTITVTDNLQNRVQYNTAVRNTYKLVINEQRMSSASAIAWMSSLGGVSLVASEFKSDASLVYRAPIPRAVEYWLCARYSADPRFNYVLQQHGWFYSRRHDDVLMGAWCLVLL